MGIGPSASNNVPVPAKQGLGLNEEPASVPTIEESAQSGKDCSVRGFQGRTGHLATQDRHLMSKQDYFDGQLVVAPPKEPDKLEHPDESQVEEGQRHGPAWSFAPAL